MTREEAIERLRVEQEPCGDAISREAAIDAIYACYIGGKEAVDKAPANDQYAEGIEEAVCAVEQLPSVTPQPEEYCDTCIHRYFEAWQCINCRRRWPSNYERREEYHGSD